MRNKALHKKVRRNLTRPGHYAEQSLRCKAQEDYSDLV